MNKKSFSISPSPNVIDVLSSAGYSLNYAIADIIDNSIYAGAKNILVFFDVSTSNPFIYILDDGKGMNIDDLKKAAVPGYTDPNADRDVNDLGRFSVGLKSAAHSFSNDLVIVSKKEKEDKCIIQIDFDYIKNKKEWTAFILNNFDHSYLLKDNGTLVFCDRLNCIESNIDFNTLCTKIDNLETALSHIYWKYIENGLNIELGTSYSNQRRKVKGWNPFFLEENKGTKKIYSESIPYKNEKIGIISYILPTYGNLSPNDQRLMRGKGLNDQQGFYVYRNNRLIQEGGWLDLPDMNLDDKCSYARIEMNIPASLDSEFKINYSKDTIILPDDLIPILTKIAQQARKESKNNYNYKKHPSLKPKLNTKVEEVWKITKGNNGMLLTINVDHSIISDICKDLSENKKKQLFLLLSKSLPINAIQGQVTSNNSYTKKEIMGLIDDFYEKMKSEGKTIDEIKKKIVTIEPFKNYKEYLIDYFGNKE